MSLSHLQFHLYLHKSPLYVKYHTYSCYLGYSELWREISLWYANVISVHIEHVIPILCTHIQPYEN